MADETVKVIRIEVGDSEQTVKGLRDSIDALRQALEGATKGTQEFKDILDQLATNQAKLTKAMSTGKKETQAAEGSYNALAKKLSELKKAWKETTDETARGKLGKEINATNDQLKKMDASVGDFRRNVGNYAGSIKDAFGKMGGAAKGMTGPLASVKQGFTALSSHPLVAVLTALAALLINGIAKGFKSSEEATNKLKTAFSGFQAIGDAINKMFQGIANAIGDLVNGIVNLMDKWGLLGKKFKERQKIAQDEIKLTQQQRENIKKKADLEMEVADLEAKAADESKYTAQERLAFLQEAGEKEAEIARMEYESLQQEYEIIKAKNALSQSSAEDKQKEAEAYAAMVQAQTNYLNSVRSTNKKVSALNKQMTNEAQQRKQAMLNLEKDLIQQQYELAKKGSEDQLRLAKDLRTKELQIQLEGLKTKIKNDKDYQTAVELAKKKYNQDIKDIEVKFNNEQVEREAEHLRNMAATMKDGSREQYEMLANAERVLFRGAKQMKEETDQQFQDRLRQYNANIRKFQDAALKADELEISLVNQIILDGTKPMSAYYAKQEDMLKEQLANITKYAEETDKEYNARVQSLERQISDARNNWFNAMIAENERHWDVMLEVDKRGSATVWDVLKTDIEKAKDEYDMAFLELFSQLKYNTNELASKIGWLPEHLMQAYKDGMEKVNNGEDPFGAKMFKEAFKAIFENEALPEDVLNRFLEGPKKIKDKTKAYNEELKQSYMDLAQYIGQCFSAIGDIYSINLENRKKKLEKEGKYDEQERKNLEKQYKLVQAMKISEAVINTLSGALAALTSPTYQSMGAIGMALAAAQAAAVTLAGAAQVYQIASTNPYSDNTGALSSGSGAMSATVTPTVSDFQPDYTTNLTGRSDTEYLQGALGKQPLWVSVVDINSAQEQGRVRVAESSF